MSRSGDPWEVPSQVGPAFFLLLMAVLFLRSLERVDERRIGFRPDGMAVTDFGNDGMFLGLLDPSEEGCPSMAEGGSALLGQLMESIGSLPGVTSVASASGFPLDRQRRKISPRCSCR